MQFIDSIRFFPSDCFILHSKNSFYNFMLEVSNLGVIHKLSLPF